MKRNRRTHNNGLPWGRAALAAALTASLLAAVPAPGIVRAAGAAESAVLKPAPAESYALNDKLKVQVKSLLNETTSEGTRIGAVVRLTSGDKKTVKIPDLELRARLADGQEVTLQASVLNAHAIRPNTAEELNYYVSLDGADRVELTDLVWYSVDWYSYPKQETVQLSVPVAGLSWNGPLSGLADSAAVKSWGDSFVLPAVVDSPIVYTPVSASRDNTAQGPVTTVKLLAENPSDSKETLPELAVDGKAENAKETEKKVYPGKRVEAGPIVLEPKEKKYIQYAIPTDKDTMLTAFNVLSPESFRQLDAKGQLTVIPYAVGRFQVKLAGASGAAAEYAAAPEAEPGTPLAFDGMSDAIDPSLTVSLAELHRHENEGEGFKTVIAKLKLTNGGDQPVPIPALQLKLLTASGLQYNGTRQNQTASEIMPQTSYVVSYAFNMPKEAKDERVVLKFAEPKTASGAPGSPIGAYKMAFQETAPNDQNMTFYPFAVKLNSWSMMARSILPSALAPGPVTYTYRLRLSMDIVRDDSVIVDQNFSKMHIELVDQAGKMIGYKDLPFTGVNRLISGTQYIQFDNLRTDEQEYPLTINIYETIATSNGDAKRLVGVLQQ